MQQRSKVLLALSLALILVFALGSVALADDYSNHWSAEFSTKAINNGWITRDANGNIQPDALATRAEYVMMLWRALGQPAPKSACPFTDIPEDATYRNAATAMYEAGVTTGTTATTFGPDLNLTREMAFTMLARAYSLTPSNTLTYQQFTDHATISEYARNAVSVLFEKGYITGVGANTCAPKQNLKRGEMIKIVIGVYDGVQAAQQGVITSATLLAQSQASSTLSLSLKLSITASDKATILVTAKDSGSDINYLGYQSCSKGDTFTANTNFKSVSTSATEIEVESNGWYAVCLTNKKGGFIYKLIEVTHITTGAVPGLTVGKLSTTDNTVTVTVTVPSGTTANLVAWRSAKENAIYTGKSDFPTSGSSNSKYDITTDKAFTVSESGWYAVCIVDSSGKFGYKLVEVTSIGTTYKLTLDYISTQDSSYGALSGDGTYDDDTSVTAKATPNTGVTFVGWYSTNSGNGTAVSTNASYKFDITKDTTLYAKFEGTPTTVAVTGVTLNKATTSIAVGGTETLTATVAPTTATTQTVTWSSSNTAVATVSSNGVVTGVAAGSATITVTTQDGSKTASCVVTVTAAAATTYTVTWNADGGTPAPTQTSVTSGGSITAPTISKTGYTLDGWYTEAAFTNKVTFPVTNVTSNKTFYAKWTQNAATTYLLTVIGGTGGGSYAANATVTITAGTAPAGQVFKNWTSSNGGTFTDANSATTTFSMPANAVTVTANY